MDKNSKIYVAGHLGLVGSAIWGNLASKGYKNLLGRSHAEMDLLDGAEVRDFFAAERPEYVVLAAAIVGGIMANNAYRADFIYKNLQIQQNVIWESFRHGVKKLLFLGSTCIYPKNAPQPMREDALLTGALEYTNEPYAIAKIAGLKMCESFNLQHGANFIAVMPTNLYGPRDNFHLEKSHVIPGVTRKIFLAKLLMEGDFAGIRKDLRARPVDGVDGGAAEGEIASALAKYGVYSDRAELWGTGKATREFMWSEDMADACVHILENVDFADIAAGLPSGNREIRNCHINIGTGEEISIGGMAQIVAQTVGYQGKIAFDATKPDGAMRKLADVGRLHGLGWRHTVEIEEGLERLYRWYTGQKPKS
jgi:GDP-L-fucose synthase